MPPKVKETSGDPARLMRDPVYQQLYGLLRGVILGGGYAAGQQFLTERQVSEQYGVSRVTANKALSQLVVAGLLEFRKGVGTFVGSQFLAYDLQSLMSFSRKAVLAGKTPSTRVLSFSKVSAGTVDPAVAAGLEAGEAESVYYFERLRLADGEPVILERRHVLANRCPGLTARAVAGSLYALFTGRYGLPITAARQTLRAVSLKPGDARRLEVEPGAAAIRVQAVGYSGGPLWVEETWYRGDRYEFQTTLGPAGGGAPGSLKMSGAPAKGVSG